MKLLVFALLIVGCVAANVAHASLLLENDNGTVIDRIVMENLPNQTITANFSICASGENVSLVKILHFGNFNMTFSQNKIENLTENSCVRIFVSTAPSFGTAAGSYFENILVVSLNDFQQLIFNINLLENKIWQVSPDNVTINVIDGQWGKLVDLKVQNNGNVRISYISNIVNNINNLIWIDTNVFNLDPLSELVRPVYYFVPYNMTPGNYSINLSVTDASGNTKVSKIIFTLLDTKYPDVTVNVEHNNVTIGEEQTFEVYAVDNKQISNVTINIDGELFLLDKYNESIWKFIYNKTYIPRNINYNIYITDGVNNVTKSGNFDVLPRRAIFVSKELDFFKVKYLGERTLKLGEINSNINYSMQMTSLVIDRENITIQIFVNDKILNNGTLTFTGSQPLLVKVKQLPSFNISTIDFYGSSFVATVATMTDSTTENPAPTITLKGTFANYEVTPSQTFDIPVMSHNMALTKAMNCQPIDVGFYENSSYSCAISFPIDIGQNLPVVTTAEALSNEREGNRVKYNQAVVDRDAARMGQYIFGGIILIALISFAIWILMLKNMHRH